MEFAMQRLVDIQYQRNQVSRARGTFRVTGDTLEVFPPYEKSGYRIEWWGDTVERISQFDPTTGEIVKDDIVDHTTFPATHYVAGEERMKQALVTIEEELHERLEWLTIRASCWRRSGCGCGPTYDLEMLREVGFCSGIENYSRHIDGRGPGTAPFTLLDYFPDDYLVVLDESHVTVPQLHGMYEGDVSRKSTLVDFGFRLPSADRQPAAAVRRVPGARAAGRVHVGDARPLRAARVLEGGRADRPPHRPDRSRGRDPADEGPGRRPDRRDPRVGPRPSSASWSRR